MISPKTKARTADATVHLLLVAVSFASVFPVAWMLLIALKPVTQPVTGWSVFVNLQPTLANVARVFELIPFWQNTWNSLVSTVVGSGLALFFSSLAGYAFAKFRFPGREILFYIVVATLFIPLEVGVVPLFVIMRNLGLVNSVWALILPKMVPAIGIFYMRQYIKSAVPDEVIEAAKIDGASDFRTFIRIVLHMIKPGLVAWGSITMVARWNDFFWPLIILRTKENFTLMLSIALLPVSEGLSTPWQVIMAGTTLAIVPVMLLYVFLQRYQISGLTSGALKG